MDLPAVDDDEMALFWVGLRLDGGMEAAPWGRAPISLRSCSSSRSDRSSDDEIVSVIMDMALALLRIPSLERKRLALCGNVSSAISTFISLSLFLIPANSSNFPNSSSPLNLRFSNLRGRGTASADFCADGSRLRVDKGR